VKYQCLGVEMRGILQCFRKLCGRAIYLPLGADGGSVKLLLLFNRKGRLDVNVALRLDVLAVCAVFAFLGALLLGAF
jgi:hypothetical protein